MRVLGIDPGYERLGIAIVEKTETDDETLIHSECVRTKKDAPFPERLYTIGTALEKIIDEYSPDVLAYERLYFNTNQKTAMNVAEVRGVISYVCSKAGLALYEYQPQDIKIALTGWGRASKQQVADMVATLIDLPQKKRLDDEFDAIAVALTHLAHNQSRR